MSSVPFSFSSSCGAEPRRLFTREFQPQRQRIAHHSSRGEMECINEPHTTTSAWRSLRYLDTRLSTLEDEVQQMRHSSSSRCAAVDSSAVMACEDLIALVDAAVDRRCAQRHALDSLIWSEQTARAALAVEAAESLQSAYRRGIAKMVGQYSLSSSRQLSEAGGSGSTIEGISPIVKPRHRQRRGGGGGGGSHQASCSEGQMTVEAGEESIVETRCCLRCEAQCRKYVHECQETREQAARTLEQVLRLERDVTRTLKTALPPSGGDACGGAQESAAALTQMQRLRTRQEQLARELQDSVAEWELKLQVVARDMRGEDRRTHVMATCILLDEAVITVERILVEMGRDSRSQHRAPAWDMAQLGEGVNAGGGAHELEIMSSDERSSFGEVEALCCTLRRIQAIMSVSCATKQAAPRCWRALGNSKTISLQTVASLPPLAVPDVVARCCGEYLASHSIFALTEEMESLLLCDVTETQGALSSDAITTVPVFLASCETLKRVVPWMVSVVCVHGLDLVDTAKSQARCGLDGGDDDGKKESSIAEAPKVFSLACPSTTIIDSSRYSSRVESHNGGHTSATTASGHERRGHHHTKPTRYDGYFPLPSAISTYTPPPGGVSGEVLDFYTAPARHPRRLGQWEIHSAVEGIEYGERAKQPVRWRWSEH